MVAVGIFSNPREMCSLWVGRVGAIVTAVMPEASGVVEQKEIDV